MRDTFRNLEDILSFKIDSKDTILERYRIVKRQIPLIYLILNINIVSLSITHAGRAPEILVYYIPGILICANIARAMYWLRRRTGTSDIDATRRSLRNSLILAPFLSIAYVSWSIILFDYGDAYTKGQILFFWGVTLTAIITCLGPIPQLSLILFVAISLPMAFFLLLQDELVFRVTAVNMVLVMVILIIILSRSNIHFRDSIEKKTELDKAHQRIRLLANRDSLTGLANRRHFFDELQLRISTRKAEDVQALVVLDLDGFKPVNDVFGHITGDRVLCSVARRLNHLLPENGLLARLGGDEFSFFVSDGDVDDILEFVEQVLTSLAKPIDLNEGSAAITATAGIAVLSNANLNSVQLYEQADYALCFAKQFSPGKAVYFTKEHELTIRSSSLISQHLRDADMDAEFSMEFQPVINTEFNDIIGFEALARWNSPYLGKVPPNQFIGAAEQAGTMCSITQVLLGKAIDAAQNWPASVRLGFNLSAVDICSLEAVSQICTLIEQKGMDPHRITFEITETAMMKDFDRAVKTIKRFKKAGMSIALDDFGTGSSSLSYLQKLPLDHVKIDRTFSGDLIDNPVSAKIISVIISLCESLDISCIIEGIEKEDQFELLTELGATKFQGFHFSKPLNPEEVMTFLDKYRMSDHNPSGLRT